MSVLRLFPEELEQLLAQQGQPAYRGRQIFAWLHRRGVLDPAQMSNLPLSVRTWLAEQGGLAASQEVGRLASVDGLTTKLLLRLADGQLIEAVEMNILSAP